MSFWQKLGQYNKLWVALTGALIAIVTQFWPEASAQTKQIVTTIDTLLTAAGVWATPNNG